MQSMTIYVTYLPNGELDGCYRQIPALEHKARMIVIDDAKASNWVGHRANSARNGLELIPPAAAPMQTEADILKGYERAVDSHLNSVANSFGYDSIVTAASYAASSIEGRFKSEGQALLDWRSLVWIRCHEVLAEVKSKSRQAPTHAELIALLPSPPAQEPIPAVA